MHWFTRFVLILFIAVVSHAQVTETEHPYYAYPATFNKWDYSFALGLSFTKLPVHVVEDEINTSPMLNIDFRLGLPKNTSMTLELQGNYFANIGSLGFHWPLLNQKVIMSFGEKTSVWFGHLELDAIHLKSMGVLVSPYVIMGMKTRNFLISSSFEIQNSYMKTQSEDVLLGEFYRPLSAYCLNFSIEQPLWNDHWVLIQIKLNYAKFFYQSWLAYSTVDEYLLYPQFSFGFIL